MTKEMNQYIKENAQTIFKLDNSELASILIRGLERGVFSKLRLSCFLPISEQLYNLFNQIDGAEQDKLRQAVALALHLCYQKNDNYSLKIATQLIDTAGLIDAHEASKSIEQHLQLFADFSYPGSEAQYSGVTAIRALHKLSDHREAREVIERCFYDAKIYNKFTIQIVGVAIMTFKESWYEYLAYSFDKLYSLEAPKLSWFTITTAHEIGLELLGENLGQQSTVFIRNFLSLYAEEENSPIVIKKVQQGKWQICWRNPNLMTDTTSKECHSMSMTPALLEYYSRKQPSRTIQDVIALIKL